MARTPRTVFWRWLAPLATLTVAVIFIKDSFISSDVVAYSTSAVIALAYVIAQQLLVDGHRRMSETSRRVRGRER